MQSQRNNKCVCVQKVRAAAQTYISITIKYKLNRYLVLCLVPFGSDAKLDNSVIRHVRRLFYRYLLHARN